MKVLNFEKKIVFEGSEAEAKQYCLNNFDDYSHCKPVGEPWQYEQTYKYDPLDHEHIIYAGGGFWS